MALLNGKKRGRGISSGEMVDTICASVVTNPYWDKVKATYENFTLVLGSDDPAHSKMNPHILALPLPFLLFKNNLDIDGWQSLFNGRSGEKALILKTLVNLLESFVYNSKRLGTPKCSSEAQLKTYLNSNRSDQHVPNSDFNVNICHKLHKLAMAGEDAINEFCQEKKNDDEDDDPDESANDPQDAASANREDPSTRRWEFVPQNNGIEGNGEKRGRGRPRGSGRGRGGRGQPKQPRVKKQTMSFRANKRWLCTLRGSTGSFLESTIIDAVDYRSLESTLFKSFVSRSTSPLLSSISPPQLVTPSVILNPFDYNSPPENRPKLETYILPVKSKHHPNKYAGCMILLVSYDLNLNILSNMEILQLLSDNEDPSNSKAPSYLSSDEWKFLKNATGVDKGDCDPLQEKLPWWKRGDFSNGFITTLIYQMIQYVHDISNVDMRKVFSAYSESVMKEGSSFKWMTDPSCPWSPYNLLTIENAFKALIENGCDVSDIFCDTQIAKNLRGHIDINGQPDRVNTPLPRLRMVPNPRPINHHLSRGVTPPSANALNVGSAINNPIPIDEVNNDPMDVDNQSAPTWSIKISGQMKQYLYLCSLPFIFTPVPGDLILNKTLLHHNFPWINHILNSPQMTSNIPIRHIEGNKRRRLESERNANITATKCLLEGNQQKLIQNIILVFSAKCLEAAKNLEILRDVMIQNGEILKYSVLMGHAEGCGSEELLLLDQMACNSKGLMNMWFSDQRILDYIVQEERKVGHLSTPVLVPGSLSLSSSSSSSYLPSAMDISINSLNPLDDYSLLSSIPYHQTDSFKMTINTLRYHIENFRTTNRVDNTMKRKLGQFQVNNYMLQQMFSPDRIKFSFQQDLYSKKVLNDFLANIWVPNSPGRHSPGVSAVLDFRFETHPHYKESEDHQIHPGNIIRMKLPSHRIHSDNDILLTPFIANAEYELLHIVYGMDLYVHPQSMLLLRRAVATDVHRSELSMPFNVSFLGKQSSGKSELGKGLSATMIPGVIRMEGSSSDCAKYVPEDLSDVLVINEEANPAMFTKSADPRTKSIVNGLKRTMDQCYTSRDVCEISQSGIAGVPNQRYNNQIVANTIYPTLVLSNEAEIWDPALASRMHNQIMSGSPTAPIPSFEEKFAKLSNISHSFKIFEIFDLHPRLLQWIQESLQIMDSNRVNEEEKIKVGDNVRSIIEALVVKINIILAQLKDIRSNCTIPMEVSVGDRTSITRDDVTQLREMRKKQKINKPTINNKIGFIERELKNLKRLVSVKIDDVWELRECTDSSLSKSPSPEEDQNRRSRNPSKTHKGNNYTKAFISEGQSSNVIRLRYIDWCMTLDMMTCEVNKLILLKILPKVDTTLASLLCWRFFEILSSLSKIGCNITYRTMRRVILCARAQVINDALNVHYFTNFGTYANSPYKTKQLKSLKPYLFTQIQHVVFAWTLLVEDFINPIYSNLYQSLLKITGWEKFISKIGNYEWTLVKREEPQDLMENNNGHSEPPEEVSLIDYINSKTKESLIAIVSEDIDNDNNDTNDDHYLFCKKTIKLLKYLSLDYHVYLKMDSIVHNSKERMFPYECVSVIKKYDVQNHQPILEFDPNYARFEHVMGSQKLDYLPWHILLKQEQSFTAGAVFRALKYMSQQTIKTNYRFKNILEGDYKIKGKMELEFGSHEMPLLKITTDKERNVHIDICIHAWDSFINANDINTSIRKTLEFQGAIPSTFIMGIVKPYTETPVLEKITIRPTKYSPRYFELDIPKDEISRITKSLSDYDEVMGKKEDGIQNQSKNVEGEIDNHRDDNLSNTNMGQEMRNNENDRTTTRSATPHVPINGQSIYKDREHHSRTLPFNGNQIEPLDLAFRNILLKNRASIDALGERMNEKSDPRTVVNEGIDISNDSQSEKQQQQQQQPLVNESEKKLDEEIHFLNTNIYASEHGNNEAQGKNHLLQYKIPDDLNAWAARKYLLEQGYSPIYYVYPDSSRQLMFMDTKVDHSVSNIKIGHIFPPPTHQNQAIMWKNFELYQCANKAS